MDVQVYMKLPEAKFGSLQVFIEDQRITLPYQGDGPRVEHIRCKHNGPAAETLALQLGVSQSAICGLMTFGAVYYSVVHPHPSQCKMIMSASDSARLMQLHKEGLRLHGSDVCSFSCRGSFFQERFQSDCAEPSVLPPSHVARYTIELYVPC